MEQHRHNGSVSVFLLGVIIGVFVTLLFTTRKGTMILQTLTEEGIDKVSLLERFLDEEADEEVVEGEETREPEKTTEANGYTKQHSTVSKVKSTARRFFKGVPHKK